MKITIIGHGYVGLVSASVFADLGNEVWVIGRDQAKIDKLKKGEILFFEPGLKEVVQRNLKAKRLKFTLSYKEAISNSQIAFICVGTPPGEGGAADLSNVFSVARQIGKNIKDYILIVCKSTVPVGTNKKIQKLLVEELKINSKRFDIASCPEFLKEGTALSDTLNPDRIVIGVEAKKAEEYLLTLHKPINGARVLTNIESAEMIKYASNAFLATKISFANALSFLCEKTGADIEKTLLKKTSKNKNIKIYKNSLAVDLIVKNNICYGVFILTEDNKIIQWFAKAVILATGGSGQVYQWTTNPTVATGDGVAIAGRAGAEISDIEFVQFHPTAFKAKISPLFLLSERLRGEGARLVDENGNQFVNELLPRDIVTRAVFEKQKTSEVFLTMAHLDRNEIINGLPNIYKRLKI